jgi:GTP cyclohydrolase I
MALYPDGEQPTVSITTKPLVKDEEPVRVQYRTFPDDPEGHAYRRAYDGIVHILEWLGYDPRDEGLRETPKRFLEYLREVTTPEPFNLTTFPAEQYDEFIVQTGIPFYSLCEHHLAPFFGYADVGYHSRGRIVGLSKLARTVRHVAAGLQNQERITTDVADILVRELDTPTVAVVIRARHLCMEMRGVKAHDTFSTTATMRGLFRAEPGARAEFYKLVSNARI